MVLNIFCIFALESGVATRNCSMKVIPSIAFQEFSGTAGDVTARAIGGRTILNHKAYQAKTKTPAQAVSRNTLSKVSRAYKQLSDSQMKAWAALAEHLKGISTFGKAAEMTAHNAFVRINANRQLVNMPLLEDAPEYVSDVPEVDYEDFWVCPDFIMFTGIEKPKESYKLVVKMSAGLGNGISSGWSKTVIVSPGIDEDWGDANITKLYMDTIGYYPQIGEKVFIELYWLDSENGFVGETMRLKAVTKTTSQVHDEAYEPRNEVTPDNLKTISSGVTFDKFYLEQAPGSAIVMADIKAANTTYVSGESGDLKDMADTYLGGRTYFPGRGYGDSQWAIGLYENYMSVGSYYSTWQIANRAGGYDKKHEVFGTSAMVNF